MMKGKATLMNILNYLVLISVLLLILLQSMGESQWVPIPPITPRLPVEPMPLCSSQLALVNHACSLLLYTPSSPPSPSTTTTSSDHHEGQVMMLFPDRAGGRSHHSGGGGGGGGGDMISNDHPVERDCCRWLKEVDDVCVCDLLVHLPSFLTRPMHSYSIVVDGACNVTFACGSK